MWMGGGAVPFSIRPQKASLPPVTHSSPKYHIESQDLRKIHKAAITGNVKKVERVLYFGLNGSNERDKRNRTALHLACSCGHVGVVSLLVDRKCQLNLHDDENRTPLMKAVQCQEEECATILLKHGSDISITDNEGNTALHYAVSEDNVSIAKKLVLHKADIEAKNKDGLTPLLFAVKNDKRKMVAFLVEEGANVNAVDNTKSSARGGPALAASEWYQTRQPGPGYHIPDRGLRKIHKAASGGNAAKVQQILLLGINDLNDRDQMNR
ncbi:uncharacterized protein AAEQ78_026295 [Lycaon pictus]